MKFETGQTSEPTSANISIVSRSSKRGPTMLRSLAQHIQQYCAGARALHATYPHKYMRTRNQHGVGDIKNSNEECFIRISHIINNSSSDKPIACPHLGHMDAP